MSNKENSLRYIYKYLASLKPNDKNEIYETLGLMILYDGFLDMLADILDRDLKCQKKDSKGVMHLKLFFSSKPYSKFVDCISRSKYFQSTFSPFELMKRKEIMSHVVTEVVAQASLSKLLDFKNINVNLSETKYPLIEHKVSNKNGLNFVNLSFYEDDSLSNVIQYIKDQIKLKNHPKKKKLSMGRGYRLLKLREEIKSNISNYRKYSGQELDDILFEEWGKKYQDKFQSKDAMVKTLRRIKSIKKQINTPAETNK